MTFFQLVRWVWNVRQESSPDGTYSVAFSELNVEFTSKWEWSRFYTVYDGEVLRAYNLGRIQIGWGRFYEWFQPNESAEHLTAGVEFFDDATNKRISEKLAALMKRFKSHNSDSKEQK